MSESTVTFPDGSVATTVTEYGIVQDGEHVSGWYTTDQGFAERTAAKMSGEVVVVSRTVTTTQSPWQEVES